MLDLDFSFVAGRANKYQLNIVCSSTDTRVFSFSLLVLNYSCKVVHFSLCVCWFIDDILGILEYF